MNGETKITDDNGSTLAPVLRVRLESMKAERDGLVRAGLAMLRALRKLRERVGAAGKALPRARTALEVSSMGLSVTVDGAILMECMTALHTAEALPALGGTVAFSPAEVEAAILIAWPVHASLSPSDFAARVRRQLEGQAAPVEPHDFGNDDKGANCLRCGVYRHRAERSHPVWAGQLLYSIDGEHWDPKSITCKARREVR